MRRRLACAGIAAALLVATALCACAPSPASVPPVPKLRPPAIASAGVLRVAVDAGYPPFASHDGTAIVGIDADVGAALAESLGLRAEYVDVRVGDIGRALRENRADIALGAVPITEAALSDVSVATSYLSDGPALFAKSPSVSATDLPDIRVAVQQGSPSFWSLRSRLGEDRLVVRPTLRLAFEAVATGTADAVAGDALVGGYILREFPAIRFAGQLADASPLAVSVAKDDGDLGPAVRDALDALASGGVLDAVRAKWEGTLPALRVVGEATPASSDGEATPTPLPADGSVTPTL